MVAGVVADRDLRDPEVAAVGLDLRLEERSFRRDPLRKHRLQRFAREQLEAARHVGQLRAEQEVGERRASAADEASPEGAEVLPAGAEAAAEDAIAAVCHGLQERGYVGRLVAEAGVDFENPVATGGECLPVAANVRICDAARLRRPDHGELRLVLLVRFEQRLRGVLRDGVEDDEERHRLEIPVSALAQNGVDKRDRARGLVRHRADDSEPKPGEAGSGGWGRARLE